MKRSEILRKKSDIDRVFSEGRRYNAYPLTMLVLTSDGIASGECLTLFSVPKRRFKKAVQRNRIRRQMKEAWRLNHKLSENSRGMHAALVFTGAEMPQYKDLEAKIIVLLRRLMEAHEETAG